MKFKTLHEKAKSLDVLIDEYMKTRQTGFVPFRSLEKMVVSVFPDAVRVSFGLHKLVFRLNHKSHLLALKVGKAEAVELDHKSYKQLPQAERHAYFARVFWHTKYSLLQEWGVEVEVSPQQLAGVRALAGKYGLLDITCDNIRSVNGTLKIIDAVIAPQGMFKLWKIYDSFNQRLPPPVRNAIRKSRLLTTVKQ